ncbi:MAG: hypothetical protein PHO37_14820 [Kiritimatiellae bacterium]|nr:hypothetical protein [Kiritimatiellia bacterium]
MEAEELIKNLPTITETHTDAMAVWMSAQANYFEHIDDLERAVKLATSAHEMAPHLMAVMLTCKRLQEMKDYGNG